MRASMTQDHFFVREYAGLATLEHTNKKPNLRKLIQTILIQRKILRINQELLKNEWNVKHKFRSCPNRLHGITAGQLRKSL